MDIEQHRYALRSGSRSRSQTPSVQSRATMETDPSEHHYDLRSRSRERSRTPGPPALLAPAPAPASGELVTVKKSSCKPSPTTLAKLPDRGAHSGIEAPMETKEDSIITKNQSHSDRHLRDSAAATRKVERYTYTTRQKIRKQLVGNGQNDSHSHQEVEQKGTSLSPRTIITSDYSSEEGDRPEEDPPSRPSSAHDIYRQAGDWWNVFPKTDYTYSQASQCRYEIAPGILAMPNMSRRSLYSDGDSAIASQLSFSNLHNSTQDSDLVDTNFLKESLPRERHIEQHLSYKKSTSHHCQLPVKERDRVTSFHRGRLNAASNIDSDTELEDAEWSTSNSAAAGTGAGVAASRRTWRIGWLFTNVVAMTVIAFRRVFGLLGLERGVESSHALHAYQYEKYYESIWSKLWRKVDGCAQYLYFFVVQIFLFDSWLLSRIYTSRQQLQERGSKFTWILLLTPLILVLGSWCLPCILAHSSAEALIGTLTRAAQRISSSFSEPHSPKIQTSRFDLPLDNDQRKGLEEILNELQSRITHLELSSLEESESLTNLKHSLQVMMAQSANQTRVTLTEGRLVEAEYQVANDHDLASIKLELESLKEEWRDLRACCKSRLEEHNAASGGVVVDDSVDEASEKLHLMKIVGSLLSLGKREEPVRTNVKPTNDGISSSLADSRVREIVREMLRVYDADKTGRVDYALESAGGLVISTRCTQRYDLKQMAIKILSFTLYYENNNPRTVIQGSPIQPGTCWAFQGFPGYLLIKLRSFVHVTGFTLEHAPKSILPNEEMKSAPRKFNVWGFTGEIDPDPVLFGDYEFLDSDQSLQYFPVQNTAIGKPYEYIELRVENNHGQLEYTCLYRFRVHGKAAT